MQSALSIAATLALIGGSQALSCIGDNGNAVDWFVLFKFPNGYEYAYADSTGVDLHKSSNSLQDAKGNALSDTLNQVIEGDQSTSSVFYNDQHPNGDKPSSTYGHSKGVLGLNNNDGFWLIHSVPRFPDASGPYQGFPDFETKYGQSMICVSLDTSLFNGIGNLLQHNRPSVFSQSLSQDLQQRLPTLAAFVIQGDYIHESATNVSKITTVGGQGFVAFAKTRYWGLDLYEDLISPAFSQDTLVESWMNGVNPLPTYCRPQYKYDAINIRTLSLAGEDYKETQDHSKWAITRTTSANASDSQQQQQQQQQEQGHTMLRGSINPNAPIVPSSSLTETLGLDSSVNYVCIGDINRQNGQLGRGGGSLCFHNPSLWQTLNTAIQTMDQC